jgi:uncharacterized protein (TIGR02391 family)
MQSGDVKPLYLSNSKVQVDLKETMSSFWDTVDPATFCNLRAEEVGLAILRWWNATDEPTVHPRNVCVEHRQMRSVPGWSNETAQAAQFTFMEGWAWLISAALIMLAPTDGDGWYCRTRRGKAAGARLSETALKAELALSRDLLHSSLQGAPWEFFGRGYLDAAVFEASKAVEVRVRRLAGLASNWIGRDLMRQVFKSNSGPLCDRMAVKGEQDSMADFFAGAIGLFKNPTSHRDEVIQNSIEAAEALMTISHLMRILDAVERRIGEV